MFSEVHGRKETELKKGCSERWEKKRERERERERERKRERVRENNKLT